MLQPSGRHDFLIRHDVKEVGQHTLICSAAYTTVEGERRFLPQYFKFTSANPLSVRTKVSLLSPVLLLSLHHARTSSVTSQGTYKLHDLAVHCRPEWCTAVSCLRPALRTPCACP